MFHHIPHIHPDGDAADDGVDDADDADDADEAEAGHLCGWKAVVAASLRAGELR